MSRIRVDGIKNWVSKLHRRRAAWRGPLGAATGGPLLSELPSQLERAIDDSVDYNNLPRYHKALGNVTAADVLHVRRDEILLCRREVQLLSISRRRVYNTGSREPLSAT